ncbi:MAG: hypothetical protein PVI30_19920 [Myxococcales bacterium]|jgi:hypothetical protein
MMRAFLFFALIAACAPAAAQGREAGEAVPTHPPHAGSTARGDEGFFLELNLGSTTYARDDDFEDRMESFEFGREGVTLLDGQASVGRRLLRNVAVGVSIFDLDAVRYYREEEDQTYEYDAGAVAAFVQVGEGWIAHRMINVFLRGSVGYAFGSSTFEAFRVLGQNDDAAALNAERGAREKIDEDFDGMALSATAGTSIMPLRNGGIMLSVRYTYAPILENNLGETRDLGGLAVLFGLRLRSWEGP